MLVYVDNHRIDANIFFLCQSIVVSYIKQNTHMHVTELTSVDLSNRPCEPLARREEPQAKGVHNYDSDSDRCIVKRLRIDRVKLR